MTDRETLEQVARKIRNRMPIDSGPTIPSDEWCELFARRLVAEWQGEPDLKGVEFYGYSDEDECFAQTIEEYVKYRNDSFGQDEENKLAIDEIFIVDAGYSRTEQWRIVSLDPIQCERVRPAAPVAAPVEPSLKSVDMVTVGQVQVQDPCDERDGVWIHWISKPKPGTKLYSFPQAVPGYGFVTDERADQFATNIMAEQEQCSYCKRWYPKPVSYHHSEDECK